jgi:hypothetical protein
MAEQFKVGERVRFLRERQEGVVVRILSTSRIEILVDDFVEMEVDCSDVVRIHAKEAVFKREEEVKPVSSGPVPSTPDREPILVINRNADRDYELWILNFPQRELYFTCFQKLHGKYKGVNAGGLEGKERRMFAKFTPHEFHMIQNLVLQVMQYPAERVKPFPLLTLDLDVKRDVLNVQAKVVPELGTEGWDFLLEEKALRLHVEEAAPAWAKLPDTAPDVVDLHAEKLGIDPIGLSSAEVLRLQLEHFERKLTEAHAAKAKQLVFIHGIGIGKLKKEIHDRLRNTSFVREFELADPLLYGNGATLVFLR